MNKKIKILKKIESIQNDEYRRLCFVKFTDEMLSDTFAEDDSEENIEIINYISTSQILKEDSKYLITESFGENLTTDESNKIYDEKYTNKYNSINFKKI